MTKIKTKEIHIDDNSGEIIINQINLNIFVKIIYSTFRSINFEKNKYYDNNKNELKILRNIEFYRMLLLGRYITKKEYLSIVSEYRELELVRGIYLKREDEDLERDYYTFSR